MNIKYRIDKSELQASGYYATYGKLIIDDKQWDIISGLWGRGTIPLGLYRVYAPRELKEDKSTLSYKGELKPWLSALIPMGKCEDAKGNRMELCIHPDGGIKGTLGCMGIQHNDMEVYALLLKASQENQKIILEVV